MTTIGTAGNGEPPAIKPWVVSFDLAGKTGICYGQVGDKNPKLWTWNLYGKDLSRPLMLLRFSDLCDAFFRDNQIDYLCYEAPLNFVAANVVGSHEQTLLLLRGLVGVLECCGARASIKAIQSFDVKDAREHLTGYRTFPKGLAKNAVMRACKMLGVNCANDNESDAFCGWSYSCALLNPRIAHLVTPLWMGQR
jgi:hypothetical protein